MAASDMTNRRNLVWNAINSIPDSVLTDYLADQVIDDEEIEDITRRLEKICVTHNRQLHITESDHAMIRHFVRHAVAHIQAQQEKIEGKLCNATLGDIRAAMGSLLSQGLISLEVTDATGETPDHGDMIPDERPDNYDEEEPNLLE